MRTAWWIFVLLATVWTCAQSTPIHAATRHDLDAAPGSPLLQAQQPPEITKRALEKVAEATTAVEKDWKRPIIITVGLIGAVGTVGWNYIAAKSFISNRRKYLDAEKALEAEKSKPKPRPGDTFCTVKTYLTEEQVSARAPSTVTLPCWRLGDGDASQLNAHDLRAYLQDRPLGATGSDTAPAKDTSSVPTQDDAAGLHKRGFESLWRPVSPYAMLMRDEAPPVHKAVQDVVNAELRTGSRKTVSHTASEDVNFEAHWANDGSWSAQEWPTSHAMVPPTILRMERHRTGVPSIVKKAPSPSSMEMDGARHIRKSSDSDAESFLSAYSSQEAAARAASNTKSAEVVVTVAKPAKKIKTEDITFALTVLNAVGTLPSLILTTLNAYLYRGNPKVD